VLTILLLLQLHSTLSQDEPDASDYFFAGSTRALVECGLDQNLQTLLAQIPGGQCLTAIITNTLSALADSAVDAIYTKYDDDDKSVLSDFSSFIIDVITRCTGDVINTFTPFKKIASVVKIGYKIYNADLFRRIVNDIRNKGGTDWSSLGYDLTEALCIFATNSKRSLSSLSSITVPPTWSCAASFYDANDGCDCNCTVWDPDCDDSGVVFGCAIFGVDAICVPPSQCYVQIVPTTWTCSHNYYNASDGCDCSCGAWDPDCSQVNVTIYGCESAEAMCSLNGTCLYPFLPSSWVCLIDSWNDGLCDCNCGAVDPQCTPDEIVSPDNGCPCSGMLCTEGFCIGECNGYRISVDNSNETNKHLYSLLSIIWLLLLI